MTACIDVALRNLHRGKLDALLQVVGLAVGIAVCIILGLFLHSELTYDEHHVRHERIYRIAQRIVSPDGNASAWATTSSALGPALAEEYPDVILEHARFRVPDTDALLRSGNRAHYWDNVYLASGAVFEMFTHEIVHGEPRTALSEPGSIAISRTMAERHFPNGDALGRILYDAAGTVLTVTLVFEDLPGNVHLGYDALIADPTPGYARGELTGPPRLFDAGDTYTYVLLPDGFDPLDYRTLSRRFFERHATKRAQTRIAAWESWAQPLAETHLSSNLHGDRPVIAVRHLYALAAVGALVLTIACVNHAHLATARARRRAKAVGIRRLLGASRSRLVAQLLVESVLLAAIATLVGVIAAEVLLTLPPIAMLLDTPLELDLLGEPLLAAAILSLGLLTGLSAGLYPALRISSLGPLAALAKRYPACARRLHAREALVLIQLTVAAALIVAALLTNAQAKDTFVTDRAGERIVVPLRGADLIERQAEIAFELSRHDGVLGVAAGDPIVGRASTASNRPPLWTDDRRPEKLLHETGNAGVLLIMNVASEGMTETLRDVQRRLRKIARNYPLELTYLDQEIRKRPLPGQRLTAVLASIAIAIALLACLGLVGLAAFAAERRFKEIGIRRTLGASTIEIIGLLSRRLLLLVFAAGIAACLAAWLAPIDGISGFAYRASIHPALPVLAILAAAGTALIAMALQSWRTISQEPANALRDE